MRWSKARQQMLAKLQQVERARRSAAEERLASARARSDEATFARDDASAALDAARREWTEHHSKGRLDIALAQLVAGNLVVRHRELDGCEQRVSAAQAQEDEERAVWRALEASVRSGDDVLRRGRRRLARQAEASRDQILSDRTTWRWFQR
jgi:hypothetical protein